MRAVAVALAMVALAGCGDDSDEVTAPDFRSDCPGAEEPAKLALEVRTAEEPRRQRNVTWQLIVTNAGEKDATLAFPTAQLGDVALETEGDEVYRWSRERTFAQSLRCFTLGPGDRTRLDLGDDQLEFDAGEYRLTAVVASRPAPPELHQTFTVLPR